MSPKRPGTAPVDRDEYVPKHPSPVAGVPLLAVPHEVNDPVTGVLQGPALTAARNKRETKERLLRLETKHDVVDAKLDGIDVRVARMEGKLDTALGLIPEKEKTKRAHIDGRTKVIIAIVGAVSAAIAALISQGCS